MNVGLMGPGGRRREEITFPVTRSPIRHGPSAVREITRSERPPMVN